MSWVTFVFANPHGTTVYLLLGLKKIQINRETVQINRDEFIFQFIQDQLIEVRSAAKISIAT